MPIGSLNDPVIDPVIQKNEWEPTEKIGGSPAQMEGKPAL
jgi:hypothetical protein